MLKKSTKITSLVVAAATMATMVPAMAAERIADKDGRVYNAVAYKDGKFYIDGDDLESADDNDGVYFLDGGKYSEVDSDIDSGDQITDKSYGEKYVEIEDGDYYLDLETGKVTDDLLKGDDREDAASALKKKIRKDDPSRYTEETRANQAEVEVKTNDVADNKDNQIWEINAPKFSTPYYETNHYKYEKDKAKFVVDAKGNVTTDAVVYTDANGKYIDVNNDLGKVNLIVAKATTAEAANFEIQGVDSIEAISFTEVGTEKGKEKAKYSIAIEHMGTLGSDSDYVYRLAALHIGTEDADGNFVSLITSGDAVYFGSTKNPVKVIADEEGSFQVIQKISKEQGDAKDDAKLPKTTQTYLLNEYKDAYKKNYKPADSRVSDFFFTNDLGFTVADGKITSYGYTADELKAVSLTLSSKNGCYYTDKDDDSLDADNGNDDVIVDTDKDGNLWALQDGKIFKYNNKGDFGSAVYKVDGGYNELSVYDENNLIAYNEDDDQYAIIGGESSTGKYEVKDEEATTDTTTTAQAGWVQDATTGAWSYVKADGTKAIGWFQSPTSGLWYYMDANGVMQANGWIQDGGYWYFLDASGAMKTGWVYTGGAWYFLKNTAGNMGAMQTGWIQTGGKWYYCNASGAMLSNTTVGGYVLGADGAWIK